MAGLPIQPLEVDDFSGGITENFLQGDPRRYAKADNLLITVDKKLEERYGIVADGATSYLISGATGQRINGYYNLVNETTLMAQVSRNLYYKNPTDWTRILGVDSKEALPVANSYSQTTYGEFQKQIYFTSDDGGLPAKIYKDETNTWVARTAGMPRAWVRGNYNDTSLLAKAMANANALKASMISHFSDAKYPLYQTPSSYETASGILHINIDRYALSYLQAVTFGADTNVPVPLPTPAPDATNQASLFVLVGALNKAYSAHVSDGMLNSWYTHPESTTVSALNRPRYHQDMPVPVYAYQVSDRPIQKTKGPGATLSANTTPTTIAVAASMLDDLLQKWNWHRLSVNTHDNLNNYAIFNRYAPPVTEIGSIYLTDKSFPTITPDFTDLYNYVNNLRSIYNNHVTNNPGSTGSGTHKQRDNAYNNLQLECTLPECTDLNSMYLLIWWLRSLYVMHTNDAGGGTSVASINVPGNFPATFRNLVFTSAVGSPNATPVTYQNTGVSISTSIYPVTGMYLFGSGLPDLSPVLNTYQFRTPTYKTAKVLSEGAGSMVIDHNFLTAVVGTVGQVGASQYHGYYVSGVVTDLPSGTTSGEIAGSIMANPVTQYGTSIQTWLDLANDLFFAMANHIQNAAIHNGAGFNTNTYQYLVASAPYQNFSVPTVETVSYGIYFSDRYKVESSTGIEYLVNGNPIFSASTVIPVSYPVGTVPTNLYPTFYTTKPTLVQRSTTLSNLPVLTNDATTNYAVSNIKLNIYRTTNGGTTYYKEAEVSNGTTSYVDLYNDSIANAGDTAFNTHETLYTSGGVVGSDQPPVSKFTYLLDTTAYWAGVYDTGQFFPNRIRQSNKNQPDSAPANFYIDLDDEITGLSSARGKLIAFCKNTVYRIDGGFNTQGQGSLTQDNITDTLGCLNAKSIIRTEIGVYYAGTDGFYYTDGYQNIKISLELDHTYAGLTASASQKKSIYGAYDKVNRRIYWAMKEYDNDSDNSVIYVYYLDFGTKPSGVFTLLRNGLNFRPSSLVFNAGVLYLAHEKGYLLKTDADTKYDITVDSTIPLAQWGRSYIPYNYTSTAISLGTTFNRKWLTKIHIVGKNIGNQAIQPYALRDLNQTEQGAKEMAPINYLENLRWGDARPVWGDATLLWKLSGKMDVWRRFPATTLRSDFMQIILKPSDKIVYSSSQDFPEFAYARVDGFSNAATIVTPSGYSAIVWPPDCVGYRMKFEFDDYATEYEVLSYSSTIAMVLSDPNNTLQTNLTTGWKWEIWGIKKEQRFSMSSYVMHFSPLGTANQAYPGTATTSGPGNGGGNLT